MTVLSGFAEQGAAGFDLLGGEGRTNLCLAGLDPGADQVAQQLADHVLVPGLFEIGLDHALGVGFGLDRRQAHAFGCPLPEQAIAAGMDAEQGVRVVRVLGFLGAFAIVKGGHIGSVPCSAGSAPAPG